MNEEDFNELLKIQQRMSRMLLNEDRVNHKIDVITLVRDMCGPAKKKVQREQVIIEAGLQGISSADVESILQELVNDNIIFIPQEGYLQIR